MPTEILSFHYDMNVIETKFQLHYGVVAEINVDRSIDVPFTKEYLHDPGRHDLLTLIISRAERPST